MQPQGALLATRKLRAPSRRRAEVRALKETDDFVRHGLYWGYIRVEGLGLYWDNGKNGNYYIILGDRL